MKRRWIVIWAILICFLCSAWGFYAHKKINETAVFLLPTEMAVFYKQHIKVITEKAIDADKRCYIDTLESPRHYIDLNEFAVQDSLPIHWTQAKEKFTERKLRARGIIPWQIARSYQQLVQAFKMKNFQQIIRYSADLGHYISDAHVPLHTTSNYNGQFTNQIGIHAFWETRLPEKYAQHYDFMIGKAEYIDDIPTRAWAIVNASHALVDSVLNIEKELSQIFPNHQIRSYITRNNILQLNYSDEYTQAYHTALNGMVERRMRQSVHQTASFWYSAWIDAGQPNLHRMLKENMDHHDSLTLENRKIIGRQEWHD